MLLAGDTPSTFLFNHIATMFENLEKYRVVLASGSPRRKSLLDGLGITYEVRTLPGIDESYPHNLQGGDIPLHIARKKVSARQYIDSIDSADVLRSLLDKVIDLGYEFVIDKILESSDNQE